MATITKEEIQDILEKSKNENKTIIIKFEADWCGPCKTLGPVLDKIAEENPEINVIKVNVDENDSLSTEYGIRSIPAVFIFKNGVQESNFIGMKSKEDILKLI